MNRTQDLFSMDWIESFDLLIRSINSFCYSVSVNSYNIEKLKELIITFPDGLGRCAQKLKWYSKLKNVMPILGQKEKYLLPLKPPPISKELDCLEQIDMLIKMNYNEWASPTVYLKKKNNKIGACTNFSMGLKDCLETYNYPLPNLEDIFAKTEWWQSILKIGSVRSKPSDYCRQRMCKVFNYKHAKRCA